MRNRIRAYFAQRRSRLRATTNTIAVTVNTALTGINVLANDRGDVGALRITRIDGKLITDGGAAINVANGTVNLVGGLLTFTPTAAYTGPVAFSYTVTDGQQNREGLVVGSVT